MTSVTLNVPRNVFIKILVSLFCITLIIYLWVTNIYLLCTFNLLQSNEKLSNKDYLCTSACANTTQNKPSKDTTSEDYSTITMSTIHEIIQKITNCVDKTLKSRVEQRGKYWVLYNYVVASRKYKCGESITYTTPGDYTFLDNVLPVVERWRGPVSVALYAPGDDFQKTIDSIRYLRDCSSPLIKEFVTFHMFFDTGHFPDKIPQQDSFTQPFNCSLKAPFYNVNLKMMYKARHNLTYPVNVARNIARETAQTHYVLPVDIELYPSPGIIERFLKMIVQKPQVLQGNTPKVFILSPFEIESDQKIPTTKTKLQEMLLNKTAVPFHHDMCSLCHDIPKGKEWQKAKETADLNVFHITKRDRYWEPVYIGTNNEPPFDERLTWNGESDKVVHGYVLCLLDYDLMVLDNAFLVHKPGIRVYKYDAVREKYSAETKGLISNHISVEYKILYGERKGCQL